MSAETIDHATGLAKTTTNLPPCVVQSTHDRLLLVGTYKLDETNRSRYGSVDVYDENLNFISSASTGSSILDLKICPNRQDLFLTGQSTGSIILWKIQGTAVAMVEEYQFYDKDVLVSSLSIQDDHICATLTSGEISLVKFENDGLTLLDTKPAHSLEAWISNFGTNSLSNVIFSGGDDSCLIAHDMRTFQDTIWNRRLHDAGVTSVLPSSDTWKPNDPYTLLTGGYDDTLRSIDLRALDGRLQPYLIPRAIDDVNLGGGVWRLVPNATGDRLLACCMYGGARVLEPTDSFVRVVKTFTEGHDSMVYGGDWIKDSIYTCSFYDKQLQKWTT